MLGLTRAQLASAALLSLCTAAGAQPLDRGLKDMLEGVWVLQEWIVDGQALRPPAVTGRWVLRDGQVLLQLARQARGGTPGEFTRASGSYDISGFDLTYGYAQWQVRSVPQASRTSKGPQAPRPCGFAGSVRSGADEGWQTFTSSCGPHPAACSFSSFVLKGPSDTDFVVTREHLTMRQRGRDVQVWRPARVGE